MTHAAPTPSTITRHNQLKPREKARLFGVGNLTTTDLLSLIIGVGTKKTPVFALAKQLSHSVQTGTFRQQSLKNCQLLGPVQYWRLQAACELALRLNHPAPAITHPKQAWHLCSDLSQLKQEHVVALYVDGSNRVLQKHTLVVGGHNFALLEPIDLLHHAIALPARGCFLVHNHPSGDSHPSQDDIAVTKRLAAACELVGITLIDHIIIGKHTYTSLKETGDLPL